MFLTVTEVFSVLRLEMHLTHLSNWIRENEKPNNNNYRCQ